MMTRRSLLMAVLGILVASADSMGCMEHIELEVDADTFVRTDLDAYRSDNYGCSRTLAVGTADAIRTLMWFDLDDIDDGTVRSAMLELTLGGFADGSRTSVFTIDAHRVLSSGDLTPWVEGDGYEGDRESAPPSGCSRPDDAYGVAWEVGAARGQNNQSQPKFDAGVLDTITIDPRLHARGDVLELDLTEVVEDWLRAGVPNYGIVLRDVTTDGEVRRVDFGSREGEAGGNVPGPRLVLELGR